MNIGIRHLVAQQSLRLTVIVFCVAAIALMPFFRYQINPDGIAYMNLARALARGDFADGVAGHWAPMLSWLLAPFVLAHVDLRIAYQIPSIGTGALAI